MKTQFTPGPWEYGRTDQWDQSLDVWESKTARTIARTVNNYPLELQEANARLIAAAPELLEALQAIVNYADERKYPMARAAISKAIGGEV